MYSLFFSVSGSDYTYTTICILIRSLLVWFRLSEQKAAECNAISTVPERTPHTLWRKKRRLLSSSPLIPMALWIVLFFLVRVLWLTAVSWQSWNSRGRGIKISQYFLKKFTLLILTSTHLFWSNCFCLQQVTGSEEADRDLPVSSAGSRALHSTLNFHRFYPH